MNATYLLMVTPEDNHNKFYRMLPNFPDLSHFTVEWGRVGATAIKKIYSMAAWDKIYKDKITKGYVDQSDLHDCVVTVLSESNYAPIADQLVAELVDALLAYSDNAIKKNYIVLSKDVTQAMIDLAREKIDQLYSVTSLSEVNAILSQLFTIIPRKMENVEDYLAHTEMDAAEIITREEALLDIMTGKVNQKTRHENKYQDGISNTILEENNLKIRPCTIVHRLGADAIFASKDQGMLVNDEVVVYDDKQATIRYLIELA